MAIQPIDLQTLFTQLDKVGKTQNAQREGLAVQQALQGAQLQRKTEERIQEVNEAQNTGEGVEKVKDRSRDSTAKGREGKGESSPQKEEEQEQQPSVISDPSLGKNIDISL